MRYTLDRIENGIYVFLDYPDETNELLIPTDKYDGTLVEGDIVKVNRDGIIEVLEEKTEITREKVNALIEKLKSKNL
ncbi:DUF3006 family protein [Ureibacillus composti]